MIGSIIGLDAGETVNSLFLLGIKRPLATTVTELLSGLRLQCFYKTDLYLKTDFFKGPLIFFLRRGLNINFNKSLPHPPIPKEKNYVLFVNSFPPHLAL